MDPYVLETGHVLFIHHKYPYKKSESDDDRSDHMYFIPDSAT